MFTYLASRRFRQVRNPTDNSLALDGCTSMAAVLAGLAFYESALFSGYELMDGLTTTRPSSTTVPKLPQALDNQYTHVRRPRKRLNDRID